MRLKRYINEIEQIVPSVDVVAKILLKDCKPYIRLLQSKGIDGFYRGLGYPLDEVFGKKKVRMDREAKGMGAEVAKRLNEWLYEYGHVRRDKAISATRDLSHAAFFGVDTMIFPIGRFKYTWVYSPDINTPDKRTGWHPERIWRALDIPLSVIGISSVDWDLRDTDDQIKNTFRAYFITDEGIEIAWKNFYEIWFGCKEYYYVKVGSQMFQSGELHKALGLKKALK
jgi:hypothetical protein